MKRILRPISYLLAAIYLCLDLIFVGIAKPISKWLSGHLELRRVRLWIKSLSPYPSLALFSVPVIALEPLKFFAGYMAATGNFIVALFTFVCGELLKLVIIERLFELTREKLLKITAFAWLYGHYMQIKAWILQSEAWRAVRSASRIALSFLRGALGLATRATAHRKLPYARDSVASDANAARSARSAP
jgi:hypothetical protein